MNILWLLLAILAQSGAGIALNQSTLSKLSELPYSTYLIWSCILFEILIFENVKIDPPGKDEIDVENEPIEVENGESVDVSSQSFSSLFAYYYVIFENYDKFQKSATFLSFYPCYPWPQNELLGPVFFRPLKFSRKFRTLEDREKRITAIDSPY